MTRFLLTAILTAACAFPCAAQTKEVVEEVDAKLAQLRIAARHADERAEDVEVLRRLLNKSLGLPDRVEVRPHKETISGSGTLLLSEAFGHTVVSGGDLKPGEVRVLHSHTTAAAVGPFDGVYLKGAGVVYTLRVPAGADLTFDPHTRKLGANATCGRCHQPVSFTGAFDNPERFAHAGPFSHATSAASNCTNCHTVAVPSPENKPLSEWEQTRLAVRGEKPKEAGPQKQDKPRRPLCDPGDLTEQLIGQLQAHARNVRHLGEKEAITLVVTFDSLPGAKAEVASGPVGKPGFTPDELQKLALGDLHAKQGKHTEAVEAYLMGLVRFRESVTLSFPPSVSHKDATAAIQDMTTSVRTIYKALAASYLQLGHVDDAKAALEKATSLTVKVSEAKAADTPKAVGPAKLILSVAKADLMKKPNTDGMEWVKVVPFLQAEFKKAVTVERVNFPAEVKK